MTAGEFIVLQAAAVLQDNDERVTAKGVSDVLLLANAGGRMLESFFKQEPSSRSVGYMLRRLADANWVVSVGRVHGGARRWELSPIGRRVVDL